MSQLAIPTIDLEDLASGNSDRVARATRDLNTAFGHFGLIYIKNHGVSHADVEAWYDTFFAFSSLPESDKRAYGRSDLWYQRGWTPPNTERAVVAGGQPDFKECYFAAPMPIDPEMAVQYPQIGAENIWPTSAGKFDAESFRRHYLSVGTKLHEAGTALLRGCARALELDEKNFDVATNGGPHVTRVLHYLPLKPDQVNTGILWGEEHTDFNLLTLLPGGRFYDAAGKSGARPDDKSGLYLRTRGTKERPQGEMVRGTPPPGCIVAQVGQQLEILTGGTYLATPHVVTAPGVPGFSRMSCAHFIHCRSDYTLFPYKKFRSDTTIRDYSPAVLAGTYGIKTLVDIGLAPPSALDRLGYRQYDRLGTIRAEEIATAKSM